MSVNLAWTIKSLLRYVLNAGQGIDFESIRRILSIRESPFQVLVEKLIEDNMLCIKDGKLFITAKGRAYLSELKMVDKFICEKCEGTGFLTSLSEIAKHYCTRRKEPKMQIDQCPVIPLDIARKVAFMYEMGDLTNKSLLCIGDADLFSLVAAAVGRPKEIYVIDIDREVLDVIQKTSEEMGFPIKVEAYDIRRLLKDEFPRHLKSRFDVFETDPPYTEVGMKCFLALGMYSLKRIGVGYVTVPFLPTEEWSIELLFKTEKFIMENGFVITNCIRSFQMCECGDKVFSSLIRIERHYFRDVTLNYAEMDIRKFYTTRYSSDLNNDLGQYRAKNLNDRGKVVVHGQTN